MDEIQYKLESKNPVLIAHAVSKLFETIRKTITAEETNISKIPEFKLLLSKKDSNDSVLSLSVSQALIALVQNELWDAGAAISTFVSTVSLKRNYVATATAIGKLILLDFKCNKENQNVRGFTLDVPQHPLIAILVQDKDSWHAVLNQMNFITNYHQPEIREQSVEILRPIFLYILCNPSSNLSAACSSHAWHLLLRSKNSLDLQKEVLLWFCTNDKNAFSNSNERVLYLAENALIEKNKSRCTVLLPTLTSFVKQLIQHGSDPQPNLNMIFQILEECDDSVGSLTLLLIAEVMTLSPVMYLDRVLRISVVVATKMKCSSLSINVLIASILNWMAYPSILCSDALDIAHDFIDKFSEQDLNKEKKFNVEDELFSILAFADPHMHLYVDFLNRFNTWTHEQLLLWLNEISLVSVTLRDKYKLILCGLFLESKDPEVVRITCNILVEIAQEMKSFASHVLSLVLHKLTKVQRAEETKYLLLAVPELISSKENVPIITHTLDTLLTGEKALRYFVIELYLKALSKEPRSYRFLSTAIIRTMKEDHSWYADATCARAMQYICENYPEHGENLVPLLSEILSRCTDTNGGTASALALKSISALCKATIIGVCSTWQVLAPKMRKEKRTIVLESLCEFFGDLPTFPYKMDEEYDQLLANVLSSLWKYAVSDDIRVAKAALKALTCYRLEQVPLRALPEDFRCDLVLPRVYIDSTIDPVKNAEDVLQYIPSACWIQMLQKINKSLLPAVGNLLISYIKYEVSGFRSGIYTWHEEPQNFKYLPDKSLIRTVGELLRKFDKTDPNNQFIIMECLRVFAHKYPKPIPNINWSFLEGTFNLSAEAKEYTLLIACHHAPMSQSARVFIENYLAQYATKTDFEPILESREYLALYAGLEDIVQVIQPNKLKLFLETTLDYVLEKMHIKDESANYSFSRIMSAYEKTLSNPEIHEGNSTLLATILERLLDQVDLTNENFKPYISATLQLSMKHLERMTSPKVWWEINPEKLKNAIVIRAEVVLKIRSESTLTWLDECIDVVSSNPNVQEYFLKILRKVQLEMQFEKSCSTWIIHLLNEIQGFVVDASQDSNKIDFYCNALFISIICLSGMDSILTNKDELFSSEAVRINLFVHAISMLAERQDWKNVIPQMMEWFHYMRLSSISDAYKSAFCSALISLRHHPHYKDGWTKYLSVKTILTPFTILCTKQ